MFADVLFVGTDANTTPKQLYHFLQQSKKKSRFLLTSLPTRQLLSTTLMEGRVHCHAVPIDNNKFIALHDVSEVSICTITNTALHIQYKIDLNPAVYSWEIIIVDNKAFVLQNDKIIIINTETGSVLKDFNLECRAVQRCSHPCMTKTEDTILVASEKSTVYAYSFQGQLKYDISLPKRIFTVEMISRDQVAIGSDNGLYVYNLQNMQIEWEKLYNTKVISLASFEEFGILVIGLQHGHHVLYLKTRENIGNPLRVTGWTTVKRVGYRWAAIICEYKGVTIIDVITQEVVREYDEKANYTVTPWSNNRLIMMTRNGISIWV